jgi:hypothetical protein
MKLFDILDVLLNLYLFLKVIHCQKSFLQVGDFLAQFRVDLLLLRLIAASGYEDATTYKGKRKK